MNIQAAQLSEDAEGPGRDDSAAAGQKTCPTTMRTAIAAAVDAYKPRLMICGEPSTPIKLAIIAGDRIGPR